MDLPDIFTTGNIRVVNKRTHTPTDKDFYIGRGSPLGNPYSHMPGVPELGFGCKDRKEAIMKYHIWIQEKITKGDPDILEALSTIREMSKKGVVYLVCYCSPLPCHGLIIKELLEKT